MAKSRLLKDIENGVYTLSQQHQSIQNLVVALHSSVKIIDDHPDPGSVVDCWKILCEGIDDTFEALEVLMAERNTMYSTKPIICELCGEPVNNFAGNPTKWAIRLPYAGGNGNHKEYHMDCLAKIIEEKTNPEIKTRADGHVCCGGCDKPK